MVQDEAGVGGMVKDEAGVVQDEAGIWLKQWIQGIYQ